MKATRHTDLAEFWQLTEPVFTADPLRNTVALTVLRTMMVAPNLDAEPPLLVTIDQDGRTVGAAFCTPPWPVGVSGVPDEAMPALVTLLRDLGYPVTGTSGPRDRADKFADAWLAATGGEKHVDKAFRLYRLGELNRPDALGNARPATEDEFPLLAQWGVAFAREVGHEARAGDQLEVIRRSLVAGKQHLVWDVDGVPVSHAAASKPIHGMSRIGPVYTPAEQRNHGYASAVTAAVAQWALDAGADHVILFTDLANPTSNDIYQKIGFVAHHDAVEYRFTHPDESGR